jgi:hypothetical protein
MRVNVAPRHKNRGRPPEKDAPGFLQWIRGRNCVLADTGKCDGKIVAAHVDYAGGKGMGTKVADRYAVPMCWRHHAEQHNEGWASFERHHKITALSLSSVYWSMWPGRVAWEAKR